MARSKTIRIGLSARLFHPRDGAMGIESKTLQVLEQSIAQWVMSRDVLVLMVPSILKDGPIHRSNIRLRDYADYLDGLSSGSFARSGDVLQATVETEAGTLVRGDGFPPHQERFDRAGIDVHRILTQDHR